MSDELTVLDDEEEVSQTEGDDESEKDLESDDELEEEDVEDDLENEENEDEEGNGLGIWDDSVSAKRMKVLLYGVSGTGKTTMAATFPKPVFLDLEGGMLSVRKFKPLRYPANPNEDIKSYSQVVDFYNLVRNMQNPPFETIVVDSLNELQLLVTQYVVSKFTNVKRQYGDQMTLADYGKANRDFSRVVRLFLKLPFNIVFTAASTQKEIGIDSDAQISPKFVGQQVGPDVQRMMDMIGYCHAKRMQDGSSQHYVSFKITPQYLAKDRLGIVERDIPNNFDAVLNSAKGER